MALALYLIGAPAAGKSAVFDALTNTPQGPHFSTKGAHRLGTVKVPDLRLSQLAQLYQPKKVTPAEVTFVDVGLPPGASEQRSFGELTTFLGDADALLLVVQAFGQFDYRGQALDSLNQLKAVHLELIVSDLDKAERRLERIAQERKKGTKGSEHEVALLQRCKAHLESERPLTTLRLHEEDEKLIRGFRFLSQKRILVVLNVSEDDVQARALQRLFEACKAYAHDVLAFCAPLEAEIAQLEPQAQAEFFKGYGLVEPARTRLIRSAYHLLDLISFFTVGEDEVRAWTIERSAGAQTAAGKIHSDIERGFIRAETVSCTALLEHKSWAKCRDHGLLRLEGKTYQVQDGDVINFRFGT